MEHRRLNKILRGHGYNIRNRPLGFVEIKDNIKDDRTIVEEALKSGKVKIKQCPPCNKKPDLRKKPRGY